MITRRQSYYSLLEIKRTASPEEIKKAFHRLAKQYHPDRNPGNAKYQRKFQDITEAYEVLSDPAKRAKYDQLSQLDGFGGFDFSAFKDFELSSLFKNSPGEAVREGLGGLYERFFGGKKEEVTEKDPGASAGPGSGSAAEAAPPDEEPASLDLHYTVSVGMETVARGGKSVLSIPREAPCAPCKGTGVGAGGKKIDCPTCVGKGRITRSQGTFGVTKPCEACLGIGFRIDKPCEGCRGLGRQVREEKIAVKIPVGVEDGAQLRLKGQGRPGPVGQRGDLRVKIQVEESPHFKRRGRDLYNRQAINVFQAILGCEVEVPTVDGKRVRLPVPAGSQPGTRLKVGGGGIGGGDLVVVIDVTVPTSLSDESKKSLEKLARSAGIPL